MALVTVAISIVTIIIATTILKSNNVIAASESDTAGMAIAASGNNSSGTNASAVTSSGTDNQSQDNQKLILTAQTNPVTTPGKDARVIVTAHTQNGTAVPAADIKLQATNYNNHTEHLNFRGATDRTGEFGTRIAIPDTAKTGQWLLVVQGQKPGIGHGEISTGIAVKESKGKD